MKVSYEGSPPGRSCRSACSHPRGTSGGSDGAQVTGPGSRSSQLSPWDFAQGPQVCSPALLLPWGRSAFSVLPPLFK